MCGRFTQRYTWSEVHAFLTERIFPHHMAVITTADLDELLA